MTTVLACYLVAKDFAVEDAISNIKTKRPGSILTPEQTQAVRDYALQLGR